VLTNKHNTKLMACSIQRNSEGLITKVTAPNGQPSLAFYKIHSTPYLGEADMSNQIYSNLYSPEIQQMFDGVSEGVNDGANTYMDSGEPRIYYKYGNVLPQETLEAGLISGEALGMVEMGIINPKNGEFIKLAHFQTNSSERAQGITDGIRSGLLSPERVLGQDGITRFQGKGAYVPDRRGTARLFQEDFQAQTGIAAKVNQDGTIEIASNPDFVTAEKSDGSTQVVHISEIEGLMDQKNITNKAQLLAVSSNFLTATLNSPNAVTTASEQNYARRLQSFLQSLGISVMSMEDYNKGSSTRHGYDPSVQGLVDLDNRVLAIAEGVDATDVITEEVSHLAIAAYADQNSIAAALSEVIDHPEYAQWAQIYRQKYSEQYSDPLELEDAVRKEILGKILARRIAQRGLNSDSMSTLWNRFVEYIRSIFKPSHRRMFDRLVEGLSADVLGGNFAEFGGDLGRGTFFSLKGERGIDDILAQTAEEINVLGRALKQGKARGLSVESVPGIMSGKQRLDRINEFTKKFETQLRILQQKVDKGQLSAIDHVRYLGIRDLISNRAPSFEEALKVMQEDTTLKRAAIELDKRVKNLYSVSNGMSPKMTIVFDELFNSLINKEVQDRGMTAEEEQMFRDAFNATMRDINVVASMLGMMSESSNPYLSLLAKQGIKLRTETTLRSSKVVNEFLDKATEKKWIDSKMQASILEKDEEGKFTGYLESAVNMNLYDKREKKRATEIIARIQEKEVSEVEKLLEKSSAKELLKTADESAMFDDMMDKEFYRNERGNYNTEEDRNKKEDKYTEAGVSPQTIAHIANERRAINEINAAYREDNMPVDLSVMSEEDRIILEDENTRLQNKRAPIDQNGMIRDGLKVAKYANLSQKQKEAMPLYGTEDFNKILEGYNGNFIVVDDISSKEDLDDETRYVLDQFNLNLLSRREYLNAGTKSASDIFFETLNSKTTPQEKFRFSIDNGRIGFSDTFYSTAILGTTYYETAQKQVDGMPEGPKKKSMQDSLARLNQLQITQSEILKSYRSNKDATQINAQDMTETIKAAFRDNESEIRDIKRSLNIEYETEESTVEMEMGLNRAYENDLIMSGKEELQFAMENMSKRSVNDVNEFNRYLRLSATDSIAYNENYETIIEEAFDGGLIRDTDNIQDRIKVLTVNYAKKRVSGYYKRWAPPQTNLILAEMELGNIDMEFYHLLDTGLSDESLQSSLNNQKIQDRITKYYRKSNPSITESQAQTKFLEDRNRFLNEYPSLRYINIQPSFAWTDLAESRATGNKGFKKVLGFRQPNWNFQENGQYIYRNQKWLDEFGLTSEDWENAEDVTQMTPRQNQNKFEFLQEYFKVKRQSDNLYGGNYNGYKAIQQSSTSWEKATGTKTIAGTKSAIRDAVGDVFFERQDEKLHGEVYEAKADGMGIMIPPIFFRQNLPDPNAITQNTITALLFDFNKANEYKVRVELAGTAQAILSKIGEQDFSDTSILRGNKRIIKQGQTSETYKKAKDWIEYAFLGKKQHRRMEMDVFGHTVDMTRALGKLRQLSVYLNLAVNPFVAATSAASGAYNTLLTSLVGDAWSADSAKVASKMLGDIPKYVLQDGKLDSNSRLGILMEAFGLRGLEKRYNESSSTRAGRLASEYAYKMDEVSNLLTIAPALYATIAEHRLIQLENGKSRLMTFEEFEVNQKVSDIKDTTAIKASWTQKPTFFELMVVENRTINPSQLFIDNFGVGMDQTGIDNTFRDKVSMISAKAIQNNQRLDGTISDNDRVTLQRDALGNMVLQHKTWLITGLTKMLKGKGYNFSSGRWEEGYMKTGLRFIQGVIMNRGNAKEFWETWKNSEPKSIQKNLKRFGLETAGYLAALVLVLALKGADDDDDPVLEDAGRLLSYRLYGEIKSSNPVGLYHTMMENLNNPVVSLSVLEDQVALGQAILSVGSDTYREEVWEKFRKGTPLRRINQISDLDETTKNWVWGNRESLPELYNK